MIIDAARVHRKRTALRSHRKSEPNRICSVREYSNQGINKERNM